MSSNRVEKSPVDSAPTPGFEPPVGLRRSCMRSGKAGELTVRVQKWTMSPACRLNCGVINQSLMVPMLPVLLKLAPAYEFGAPACAWNTVEFPWNQLVVPRGAD